MSKKTIMCIGDSQTAPDGFYGVRPDQVWPAALQQALSAAGANVRARNFGIGGDTTATILARADVASFYDQPTLAILYAGVNDPGASISQAQTQANFQAIIKAVKHGAAGASFDAGITAANPAALPATGKPGQRYVVLADNSTTGGAAAWNSQQAATITGTLGSPQSVWEFRYPLAGVGGWGRIAVAATAPSKVPQIAVVSTNYLNFTTGGDTPSSPSATNATLRAAALAAVTAENVTVSGQPSVIYTDLYGFQRARIVAGTDPDFSAVAYAQATSWHVSLNNQHHNPYGHALVAQAILNGGPAGTAIPAAWITALS